MAWRCLHDLAQHVVAREVAQSVVDRLEVVDIDLDQPVCQRGSLDVGPDGSQVLDQATPIAGPGQWVDPRCQLEGVMDAFEFDHVGVRAAPQRPDVFQLREAADLGVLEQDVARQASPDRDDHHHEQVVALGGREPLHRVHREVHGDEDHVGQQPAEVRRRAPRQHERHEAGQQQQVAGRLDGEARDGEAGDHGREHDARRDGPGDEFGGLAHGPCQRATQPASAPAITARSRTMANQTSPGFSSSRAARSRATAAATHEEPRPRRCPRPASLDGTEPDALAPRHVLAGTKPGGERP